MTFPPPEQPGAQGSPEQVPDASVQDIPAQPIPTEQSPYPAQQNQQSPYPAQATPAQAYPAAQNPYPVQQFPGQQFQGQQYQAAPQGQGTPVKGPFAAITIRDYVVDAIALTLLVISLFLPWRLSNLDGLRGSGVAASHIGVLLATIVSMLSLGLTYVWRAGAFGPSWNYKKMQDVRLLANLPYLVVAVVYLVIELVSSRNLGNALAFGLAGALLAATPRQSELGDREADVGRDKRWVIALCAVAGLSVLTVLIQIVKYFSLTNSVNSLYTVMLILLGLLTPALFGVVAWKVLQKSQTWRLVGMGIGLGGLLLAFIALSDSSRVFAGFYGSTPMFSVVFWLAFGAIAAAPSVGRLVEDRPSPQKWQALVGAAMKVALFGSAAFALLALVNLIRVVTTDENMLSSYYNEGPVEWVFSLVFAAVAIAGFFVASTAWKNGTRQGHQLVSAYAGLLFVLYLVLIIIGGNSTSWSLMGPAVILAFVIPVAMAVILWAPAAMREHFGALPQAGTSHGGFSFEGVNQAPAQHPGQQQGQVPAQRPLYSPAAAQPQEAFPVAQGAPVPLQHAPSQPELAPVNIEAVIAEASNPTTTPARLHELAVAFPAAHSAIAANPGVYPELRDWLASRVPVTVPTASHTPEQTQAQAEETASDATPLRDTLQSSEAAIEEVDGGTRVEPAIEGFVSGDHASSELDALLAEAANPNTTAVRLQELAASNAQLHAGIAGNPAAYPQLLQWLAGINSPGVAEALQKR